MYELYSEKNRFGIVSKKKQIISWGQNLLPKSDYRSQEILSPDLGLTTEHYRVKQKVQVKTTSHALRKNVLSSFH